MRVSQLNRDGILIDSYDLGESDRDPLEPEKYLIPGGCVAGEPEEVAPYGYVSYYDHESETFSTIPNPYPVIEHKEAENWGSLPLNDRSRVLRNKLLLDTDWTQLADVPKKTRDLYRPYRQALRDVPQQEGFPMKISWPVNPAEPIPDPEVDPKPEPEPEPDPE